MRCMKEITEGQNNCDQHGLIMMSHAACGSKNSEPLMMCMVGWVKLEYSTFLSSQACYHSGGLDDNACKALPATMIRSIACSDE